MSGISDFLRRIVVSELRGESDAELLGRFVANRDEAAFTAIVRRHEAMVYRVCRGVLRNDADAEDASQATFLVLAQKAAQVRKRGSLSSWLHGVALRISRKLRASIARRRGGEAQLPPLPSATPDDWSVREAEGLLHEELERLPDRYKHPLVLCYLQGKTHDEAAAELGCTLTVFRGRLERARKQLHDRLSRRGLTLTAALITGVLAEAHPAMATTFAIATARAAAAGPLLAASRGLISPLIAQLTQEILGTMTLSSLKIAVSLIAAMILTTGGYLTYHAVSAPLEALPQQPNAEESSKPLSAELRGRILMCRYDRFARIGPNANLAWASKELRSGNTDEECILHHRLSPDGKSVAFKHQTLVGEVLSVWKFDQAWPGKVVWSRRELIADFFWMPDGKNLVLCQYQTVKDGLPSDFRFRLLDVTTRKVSDLKLLDGHWPADVSADGKWFLTMKYIDAKKGDVGANLYRVERSNGKARQLFDGVSIMIPPKWWRISPDGRRVAGLSNHDARFNGARRLQLFVSDVKAGTLRQVTQERHHLSNFFGWSPDGQKLLYQIIREPAVRKAGGVYHQILVAIDAGGGNRLELFANECHYNAQGQKQGVDMIEWADWR